MSIPLIGGVERAPRTCLSLGYVLDSDKIVKRDIVFRRGRREFLISVGTPEHIATITEHNTNQPEELALDTNIYPFPGVGNLRRTCAHLHRTPLDQLTSYITEITAS